MARSAPARYTLDHTGHALAVETHDAGLSTIGRLFVDGQQVDEQKNTDEAIVLNGGGLTVVVALTWMGKIKQILAVPAGTDPKHAEEEGIAFSPPVGSHAARMEELAREKPELYAARHVAIAIMQTLIGVLGIGALLWGLLPRIGLPDISWPEIDLPAIPLPTINLPDIPLPDIPWPAIPWPAIALPDLSHLAWITELWDSFNWVVPIVIALFVAWNELEKRRKRQKAEAERKSADSALEGASRESHDSRLAPSPAPLIRITVDHCRFL